jgi:hypothetical protein
MPSLPAGASLLRRCSSKFLRRDDPASRSCCGSAVLSSDDHTIRRHEQFARHGHAEHDMRDIAVTAIKAMMMIYAIVNHAALGARYDR